jgi:hypothetical protein
MAQVKFLVMFAIVLTIQVAMIELQEKQNIWKNIRWIVQVFMNGVVLPSKHSNIQFQIQKKVHVSEIQFNFESKLNFILKKFLIQSQLPRNKKIELFAVVQRK